MLGPKLRDDLPRYPPTLQLLRVTPATVPGPAGVAQVAGSSVPGPLLYVAFTQQLRTDGLIPRDREPCLADDVNNTGLLPGFHLGRLAGSHNSLPVYEVVALGPTGSLVAVQGPVGATGATGGVGSTGAPGTQGTQGTQGIQGIQGNTGNTGATGAAGPAGSLGPCGSAAVSEGFTGSKTVVTNVTCTGNTLVVTKETWVFNRGRLCSIEGP